MNGDRTRELTNQRGMALKNVPCARGIVLTNSTLEGQRSRERHNSSSDQANNDEKEGMLAHEMVQHWKNSAEERYMRDCQEAIG